MARILVVEDNDEIAAYLIDMLHSAHYEIDRAATAEGAVLRVKHNRYDLILMDLLLLERPHTTEAPGLAPSANGAITTMALRYLGYVGPVIMLTGNLAGIDEEVIEAARFTGRLLKPALPKDVLPAVARYLKTD